MKSLRELWEEYEILERQGVARDNNQILELEQEIHLRQKSLGTSPFDFNKRWARKLEMGTPTLQGTKVPDVPEQTIVVAPQSNFTYEQARKIWGENEDAIIADCVRHAEAFIVVASYYADRVNPQNLTNLARRGQVVNLAKQIYDERKKQ